MSPFDKGDHRGSKQKSQSGHPTSSGTALPPVSRKTLINMQRRDGWATATFATTDIYVEKRLTDLIAIARELDQQWAG